MRKLVYLLVIATSALLASDNTLTTSQAQDGSLLLFDGESLVGWTPENGAVWSTANGTLFASSDSGYLRSNSAFADFSINLDFRTTAPDADCKLYLRAAPDGDPHDSAYALQIGDSQADWPTGSIVGQYKAPPSHTAPNQWHSIEATLSGEQIAITLDGKKILDVKDPRSKAGFIALGCSRAGKVQFRNIKLRPLEMKALFNGNDLAGWKMVGPPPPPKKGGLFHLGGGTKQKEAEWAVIGGAVHGGAGVGQLETGPTYDDFLLQLAIRANSTDKKQHPKGAVLLRGDPGKLASGYEVQILNDYKNGDRIQPVAYGTGSIVNQAAVRKALGSDDQFFVETIAATGRHIQVWINGYPVTDFQDTRADDSSAQKGARTAAGTISLQSTDEKSNLDFRNIRIAQLPKTLGKGPAPAAVAANPATMPGTPTASAGGATGPPVIQMPTPAPDPNKPKIQKLMAQALATNDPQQQLSLYNQILVLDPDNPAAASGRQQAQQKIDEANAQRNKQQAEQQQQAQTQETNQAQATAARQAAETAFYAGDMVTAQKQLAIAERVMPTDPLIQELRSRVDQKMAFRERLKYLLSGAGVLALVGLIVLWWKTRGKKQAYLEVIEGLDKGKRYNLDQEIIHIGAVAQDGGNKNEVVVRDVERMISRFHCEIHSRNGKFFLIDCGSANGTTVDRKPARPGKPVRLKKGSRLELAGKTVLRIGFDKRKKP
jgi:hypothetical protein